MWTFMYGEWFSVPFQSFLRTGLPSRNHLNVEARLGAETSYFGSSTGKWEILESRHSIFLIIFLGLWSIFKNSRVEQSFYIVGIIHDIGNMRRLHLSTLCQLISCVIQLWTSVFGTDSFPSHRQFQHFLEHVSNLQVFTWLSSESLTDFIIIGKVSDPIAAPMLLWQIFLRNPRKISGFPGAHSSPSFRHVLVIIVYCHSWKQPAVWPTWSPHIPL